MTEDRKTPRDKTYHHGNLREALVQTALERLSSHGAEGLSLRAVARAAGVSHMAPYHHFGDKRGLVTAVAAAGFHLLRTEMLARMTQRESDPGQCLQESAIAAVLFAAANPHLYRLMFGPVLADRSENEELALASGEAFAVVLNGLSAAASGSTRESKEEKKTPPPDLLREVGLASWAMIHGIAMLVIDGQFETKGSEEIERVAKAATDLLWHGLSSFGPPV